MKKIIILTIICVFSFNLVFPQSHRKFWGGIEVAKGMAFSDQGEMYDVTFKIDHDTYNSLRAVFGYYVTPDLSLGASIGLAHYNGISLNTAPVCLDIRYHPLPANWHWTLLGDIGYSIMGEDGSYKSKMQADIAIGYDFRINKKNWRLIPSLGYNYNQYTYDYHSIGTQNRHSLFLRLGLTF